MQNSFDVVEGNAEGWNAVLLAPQLTCSRALS